MNSGKLCQALLLLALFLAPITGGQYPTDVGALLPGESWIPALFGSGMVPFAGSLLPAAFTLLALMVAHTTRRVVQVPFPPFTVATLVIAAAALLATMASPFKGSAVPGFIFFACQVATPFAMMAVLGRNDGPKFALSALASGCAVLGAFAIQEYVTMRTIDPNWRVFATWINPNALAGMLIIGLIVSIGLATASERVERLAFGGAALLCGAGLLLTQSKGGYLAVAIGGLVFAALCVAWGGKNRWRAIGTSAAIVLVIAAVGFAITRAATVKPGQSAALARVGAGGETKEQSTEFRKMLWTTAIQVTTASIIGSGSGSFQHESTKPGIVPSTGTAHQGFLQMAVEYGVLATLAFLTMLALWAREAFRAAAALVEPKPLLKASVVAAVAGSLAHNMVDSDLQHFGTGFALFALLGIGMQLASDAVTPEPFPKPVRHTAVGLCAFLLLGVLSAVTADVQKAYARGALMARNPDALKAHVGALRTFAPFDAEAPTLELSMARSPEETVTLAREAVAMGPSLRRLRTLARAEALAGNIAQARSAIGQALLRDPNNLLALKWLMEFEIEHENDQGFREAAERMIAVEKAPYYQIRAVPELVVTETFEARIALAAKTPDTRTRIELLKGAVEGFENYRSTTMPKVLEMARLDPPEVLAGESAEDVARKMTLAAGACQKLIDDYRTMGKSDRDPEVVSVLEFRADFEAAASEAGSLAK